MKIRERPDFLEEDLLGRRATANQQTRGLATKSLA